MQLYPAEFFYQKPFWTLFRTIILCFHILLPLHSVTRDDPSGPLTSQIRKTKFFTQHAATHWSTLTSRILDLQGSQMSASGQGYRTPPLRPEGPQPKQQPRLHRLSAQPLFFVPGRLLTVPSCSHQPRQGPTASCGLGKGGWMPYLIHPRSGVLPPPEACQHPQ